MACQKPNSNRRMIGMGIMLLAAAILWMAKWPSAQPGQPPGEGSTSRRSPEAHPPGFRDIAAAASLEFHMSFLPSEQGENFKVNLYDHGCGLAVADYDGDGDDDVLFLNQLGPNALFRNRGDGTFEDVTRQAGAIALNDRVKVAAAFGDYDNDNDQDLYITSTRGGNVLLENIGGGGFRDVTETAGVGCIAHSQTPAFFDYDNDGDLDLFVTNTARWTSDEFDELSRHYIGPDVLFDEVARLTDFEKNILYRNDGQGRFSDVTAQVGLEGPGWSGDVAAFDFDEDGWLDLLVTNMFGVSRLYRNEQGRFHDVTREALGRTSYGAIGSKAFDFNNDGRFDLFIADMHSDMWIGDYNVKVVEPTKKYPHLLGRQFEFSPELAEEKEALFAASMRIDYDAVLFGNTLFRNDGGGRFTELSDAAGMETFWPWGVATGDFNGDGYEDIYLPSGMGYPFFYYPSCLMINRGDGTFVDRAASEGIEPPPGGTDLPERIGGRMATRSSRCAATADFDGDGRLDLVVNNFHDRPYCFKNQFPKRHYLALRLHGTKSNHDAVGAVVKLVCGDSILTRQVPATGGYLSQSSKTLHFGLGDDLRIDHIEIRWPSGRRQTLPPPEINRLHEIFEPVE